jgi:hypothetical protein
MTKKLRTVKWCLWIAHVALNVGPLLAYIIKALIESDLVSEKVSLCCSIVIVGILSAVCLINKSALRSRIWIIMLGIYICLDNIITPLVIIAVTQILDELIVAPLLNHYKTRLTISKELDRRLS